MRIICLVKNGIEVKQRDDLMSPSVSSIWLEMKGNDGKKVLFSYYYREFDDLVNGRLSVDKQIENFEIFSSQVESAAQEANLMLCMGDFNINADKLKDDSYYLKKLALEYQSLISSSGIHMMTFGDTYFRIHEGGIERCRPRFRTMSKRNFGVIRHSYTHEQK